VRCWRTTQVNQKNGCQRVGGRKKVVCSGKLEKRFLGQKKPGLEKQKKKLWSRENLSGNNERPVFTSGSKSNGVTRCARRPEDRGTFHWGVRTEKKLGEKYDRITTEWKLNWPRNKSHKGLAQKRRGSGPRKMTTLWSHSNYLRGKYFKGQTEGKRGKLTGVLESLKQNTSRKDQEEINTARRN